MLLLILLHIAGSFDTATAFSTKERNELNGLMCKVEDDNVRSCDKKIGKGMVRRMMEGGMEKLTADYGHYS